MRYENLFEVTVIEQMPHKGYTRNVNIVLCGDDVTGEIHLLCDWKSKLEEYIRHNFRRGNPVITKVILKATRDRENNNTFNITRIMIPDRDK